MKFIRSYNNNLISNDKYISRKKEYDSLESETFEDVKIIKLHTETYTYTYTDKDIAMVIESYNYFTIIPKDGLNDPVKIIKYNLVEKIDMYMNDPININ